ncbi:hypothetical protein TNCV_4743501 [Trichonephila clavipes]|nr:hypothetical protein TNCV_4743501 [Trichonephila clavipes]
MLSAKLNPGTGSHRQSSGASLWGGNCASKLLAVIGIAYMVLRQKVIPAPGEVLLLSSLERLKYLCAAALEKKIIYSDMTSFDNLNLPQFDWLEIEEI